MCILMILCLFLASCEDAVVNPGNTFGSGTENTSAETTVPVMQATENAIASSPESENNSPNVEKTKIIFDWIVSQDNAETDYAYPTMRAIQNVISLWEEDSLPCAVCMVTVRDIDYAQITEEAQEIPIVISIDKIFEKNAYFTENEGTIVSAINDGCDWYIAENAVTVRYLDFTFPVAEVGERYIAVLLKFHDNTGTVYNMGGISVPLPDSVERNDTYFEEQYQRLGIYWYVKRFAQEVLDKWFYPTD